MPPSTTERPTNNNNNCLYLTVFFFFLNTVIIHPEFSLLPTWADHRVRKLRWAHQFRRSKFRTPHTSETACGFPSRHPVVRKALCTRLQCSVLVIFCFSLQSSRYLFSYFSFPRTRTQEYITSISRPTRIMADETK